MSVVYINQSLGKLLLLLSVLLVSLLGLLLVLSDILPLQLPHALDLVQVNHEALIVRMELLYTLSAEYSQMVGAVEMLHSLLVLLT